MRLTVRFGKRNRSFKFELEEDVDLREQVKRACKLQIPKRVLVISLSGTKISYDPKSPREFLRHLRQSELSASITPFEVGNYEISEKELGSGSFSQVYLGRHKVTKEEVAIKVVDTNLLTSGKAQEYHEREKKIASTLDHPNIVALRDMLLDREEGGGEYYYFVMEICKGGSLDSLINKKPLTEAQAKRFLTHIVDAFRYLSQRGIVHRDLKPQNILLTSADRDNAVLKLCDFGFSRYYKSKEDEESINESMIRSHPFSPLYAAPDVLNHKPYDDRCDVWSVGAIFYEMLVGRPLFRANNMNDLYRAQKDPNFLKISEDIALSRQCRELLSQMLEPNPQKRLTWEQLFRHHYLLPAQQHINCVPTSETYSVEVKEDLTIISVKRGVEGISGIPAEDQLLLNHVGKELTDEIVLRTGDNCPPLVLFRRSSQPIDRRKLAAQVPNPSINGTKKELVVAPQDLPLKHLLGALHEVSFMLEQAQELSSATAPILEFLQRAHNVVSVHSRGIPIGCAHLKERGEDVLQSLGVQKEMMDAERSKMEEILNLFDKTLEKMSKTELHSSLRSENRKYLLDCFPHEEYASKFKQCKQLEQNISKMLQSIEEAVPSANSNHPVFASSRVSSVGSYVSQAKNLEPKLRALEEFITKEHTRLTKEVRTARLRLSDSTLRHDDVSCNDQTLETIRQQLESLHREFGQVTANALRSADFKFEAFTGANRILEVKKILEDSLGDLRQLRKHIALFFSLREDLGGILRIPEAYEAYLSEMSRRTLTQTLLKKKVEMVSAMFTEEYQSEESRLSLFYQQFGKLLPAQVFPGVNQQVIPTVEVTASNFPDYPIGESSISAEMLGREFAEILDEGFNATETKRENEKLRKELLELIEKNASSQGLKEIAKENQTLSEKLHRAESSMATLLQSYEDRIKEMREKPTNDSLKINQEDDGIGMSKKEMEELLKQTQATCQELQSKLNTAQEEKSNFQDIRKHLLACVEELRNENDNLKRHESHLSDAEIQMAQQRQRIDELEEEFVRLNSASAEAERKHAEERKALEKKLDHVKKKAGYAECPICEELFGENSILQHINRNHP